MAMMLGDILAAARDRSGAFAAWLEAADPALSRSVAHTARRDGTTPEGVARGAVAEFSRSASEEEWAGLMSKLRDSDDPGMACLDRMVRWRIAAADPAAHPGGNDEREP